MSMLSEHILRAQLREAFKEHAVLHGEFTFSSGQRSNNFIDAQRALLSQPGFSACGALLDDLCFRMEAHAIGGPATGAIAPVCAALSRSPSLRGFYLKQTPGQVFHGPGGDICGIISSSDRVIVVEDVVTTGKTLQWAIDHLLDVEGIPTAAAVAVVDRSEQSLSFSVPYTHLLTLSEIV